MTVDLDVTDHFFLWCSLVGRFDSLELLAVLIQDVNNGFNKAIRNKGIKQICETTLSCLSDSNCGLQLEAHVIHLCHDVDEVVGSGLDHVFTFL